jgi:hypothetical protein
METSHAAGAVVGASNGAGNLIQHEHVASTSTPKIKIGPDTKRATADIKLNKDGDTITSFEVKCGCGEVIVIECEY